MSVVLARCSQCGYIVTKEFDLVGVALHNAAIAWCAEVQIQHNAEPSMDHQITITLPHD